MLAESSDLLQDWAIVSGWFRQLRIAAEHTKTITRRKAKDKP
jgi:hypothetical protein